MGRSACRQVLCCAENFYTPVVRGSDTFKANLNSMYSSTAAPPQSTILFAYGSSHGIMTLDKNYDVQTIGVGQGLDANVS